MRTKRHLARFLGLTGLLGMAALVACVAERERPLPLGSDLEARLTVTILSPKTGDAPLVAGRDVTVNVHAAEPGGQLRGVGVVVRPSFAKGVLVERSIFFAAAADTTLTFRLRIPADLQNNTQVDIVGVAYGPGDLRRESLPAVLMILRCTPGAVWCG